MRHLSAVVVASVFLFAASPALAQSTPSTAQSDPEDAKKEEPKAHTAYVSFSPLHLIFPVIELTGEVRLHRQIGIAAIAGYGSLAPPNPPPGVKVSRFSVWELGGQFVGYPVGHFDHGMQLGMEALYVGVSGDMSSGNVSVSAAAQGLAVGPFVGYKYTAPIGFSVNMQGGAEYVVAQAESTTASTIIPLVNLNVGWAF